MPEVFAGAESSAPITHFSAFGGNMQKYVCRVCGQKFYCFGELVEEMRLCSYPCKYTALDRFLHEFEYECLFCGRLFWANWELSEAKQYCSENCHNREAAKMLRAMMMPANENAHLLTERDSDGLCRSVGSPPEWVAELLEAYPE